VIGEPGNPERLLGFYFRDGIIVLVPVLVLVYVKRVPLAVNGYDLLAKVGLVSPQTAVIDW
jgi:hypothetical protein